MATPASDIDLLLSKVTIQVLGAWCPARAEPLQCFRPVHRTYQHPPAAVLAPQTSTPTATSIPSVCGGSLRVLHDATGEHEPRAVVYDRDIEKSFEWALGEETMLIAVEAFLDDEHGRIGHVDSEATLLRRFADYVRTLGTQPVTVTISSLVNDMLARYVDLGDGRESFAWRDHVAVLRKFVLAQECFFFDAGRSPAVQVTFELARQKPDGLDIHLHFAWNPPVIGFHNLCNVISEGDRISFRPTIENVRQDGPSRTTTEFFIGPTETWLKWDEASEKFEGIIPGRVAAQVGAERLDRYTIQLDFTARLTNWYPGNFVWERLIRCALPVTVKRKPATCTPCRYNIASPPVPRTNDSRLLRGTERHRPLARRLPLLTSPLRKTTPRSRPSVLKPDFVSRLPWGGKENEDLSTEEAAKLLKLKEEQQPRGPQSPVRLHSLSLARFHEAVGMLPPSPPSSLSDFEVRTVRHIVHTTPASARHARNVPYASSAVPISEDTFSDTVDLGSTHIDRRGRLASRSPSASKNRTPTNSAFSTPAKNITPPAVMYESSPEKRGRSSRQRSLAIKHWNSRSPSIKSRIPRTTCYSCAIRNRRSRFGEENGVQTCLTCASPSKHHVERNYSRSDGNESYHQQDHNAPSTVDLEPLPTRPAGPKAEDSPQKASLEAKVEDWQVQIQKNFEEFEARKREGVEENLDVTMDDLEDSDESFSMLQDSL
ncbi:hypothetical protein BDY17DRAFT_324009 [Neohortaea acidophila]|uniref:Uncharacterized protein n=1 Tax=Neohortaea acidophila TaxID=245834 RepID=A0A6A6PVG3_9PEZI|nr:uncharacterized protein BDY17DRAFT_324009 [Neohortaea acidophila]KAF2483257.1 hypothetical protein BDY17DRAFT_324009 [Neohortaea acidophila]